MRCGFSDCTDNIAFVGQVWRVNGQEKILLPASDQSKLYSGDCYIFQYAYPGEEKEEYLIGTWFGKQSVEVKVSTDLFPFIFSSLNIIKSLKSIIQDDCRFLKVNH